MCLCVGTEASLVQRSPSTEPLAICMCYLQILFHYKKTQMFVKSSTWLNKWCSWLYKDCDTGLFYGKTDTTQKRIFAIRFYWSQGSSSYSQIKWLITNEQAYMESASTKLCWFPTHDNTYKNWIHDSAMHLTKMTISFKVIPLDFM